jgi:hypothetical protein
MTTKYLFAFDHNDLHYDVDGWPVNGQLAQCAFWLTDASYFEANGHMECKHISLKSGGTLSLPDFFDEVQESGFMSSKSEDETRAWLEENGFQFSDDLQACFSDD